MEPLCCREQSTKTRFSQSAGYWGGMGSCDSSMHLIQNMIQSVSRSYADQYKYLIFTGDYIAHDVWNTTKSEIISTTRSLNEMFKNTIPKDKVVIPVIGNHEGYPVDQYVAYERIDLYQNCIFSKDFVRQIWDWSNFLLLGFMKSCWINGKIGFRLNTTIRSGTMATTHWCMAIFASSCST